MDTCIVCGRGFPRSRYYRPNQAFCSYRCRNVSRANDPLNPASGAPKVWSARRAIFERDGWICGLCGEQIDPNLKWPDPMCGTLDHIVPIALGGSHDTANRQAAHLGCNSAKGIRRTWISPQERQRRLAAGRAFAESLRSGDIVDHPSFGIGIVQEIDRPLLNGRVRFEDGERLLALEYAPLTLSGTVAV